MRERIVTERAANDATSVAAHRARQDREWRGRLAAERVPGGKNAVSGPGGAPRGLSARSGRTNVYRRPHPGSRGARPHWALAAAGGSDRGAATPIGTDVDRTVE